MILDFSIGNYRSLYKIQTLNFRATSLVSEDKTLDSNNIVETEGGRILKAIGIYGPNGSGKSNLVKGLRIFRNLVEGSLVSETIMDDAAEPFKLTSEKGADSGFFQIQLLIDQRKYRYGFTLQPGGAVLQEWLFGPAEKNETWYFKRSEATVETNKEWFEEAYSLPFDKLRSNTLFLTFVSAYNGQVAQSIRNFITRRISFQNVSSKGRIIVGISSTRSTNRLIKEGRADLVLEWLKSAGLVYSGINVEDIDNFVERVLLEKNIFDKFGKATGKVQLDLDKNESAGTKKFYGFIGTLYQMFSRGGVLVSDEIDNNFHPSLLQQFIRFFNDPDINKAGAQLVFTSHDTNLMQPDILRRDQIYFTEKSHADETILYSLADLKGIRNNADFARQYLAGFYGALPLLEKYKQD